MRAAQQQQQQQQKQQKHMGMGIGRDSNETELFSPTGRADNFEGTDKATYRLLTGYLQPTHISSLHSGTATNRAVGRSFPPSAASAQGCEGQEGRG